MSKLLTDMRAAGTTQADISRLTGIKQSYLSSIEGYERTGAMSIGAEIVRLMQDRMGVATGYFYDNYEDGTRSYTDYSMVERREDKERDELKLSVADLRVQFARLLEELAAIRADFATERRAHSETRRELAAVQGRKPRPRR